MPPEPLPWDRKDFFKERKHERSESLGSLGGGRWRESSSHYGSKDFHRWGSDFRRLPGHGKQGGPHMFTEEPGAVNGICRSGEKMLEDENCRPSISRGEGKYGRSIRDNRGYFSQRDYRGHSWEMSNGSPNVSRRPSDANSDPRSVDEAAAYPNDSHPDFIRAWDHQDKLGNGSGTGQTCERENALGSVEWKALKWNRSGRLPSRGSGLSQSSSSRSNGGVDLGEGKTNAAVKSATPVDSLSGDAACVTSSAPCEETTSRKKQRLGWGEGLAKYEKKKIVPSDMSIIKDGAVFSNGVSESSPCVCAPLVDKSPRITGCPDCESPATPSSVACSSSPGLEDKLFGKGANVDHDVCNSSGSPGPLSQNHIEMLPFNLKKLDSESLAILGSSITELLQEDMGSVDSTSVMSSAMSKLLLWKVNISKVLETTESEIDLFETELKLLRSGLRGGGPHPEASSSFAVGYDTKPSEECIEDSNIPTHPKMVQIVSPAEESMEKQPIVNGNLRSHNEAGKDEDIDSSGTATSNFDEPMPLVQVVKRGACSTDISAIQSASLEANPLVACSNRSDLYACGAGDTLVVKGSVDITTNPNQYSSVSHSLCDVITTANRKSAKRASEVFDVLLGKDWCMFAKLGAKVDRCNRKDALMKEKFASRKRLLRFRERVATMKFRALRCVWKDEVRLLSVKKCRPKSQRKLEVGVRASVSGYQKPRSSVRSRVSFSAGNLSWVPASEMIAFTKELLSTSKLKPLRSTLKMPEMILDDKEKMVSRFVSNNGLVEDPVAFERERAMINPWTSDEKEIFLDKLVIYGKDFCKIASFLDHKTTADCVEFYYKNHKSEDFNKIMKKQGELSSGTTKLMSSGSKWNRAINASSMEILSAASVMAGQADGMTDPQKIRAGRSLLGGYSNVKTSKCSKGVVETSKCFIFPSDERETVAADVLAGISCSFSPEVISSCITNSVDPAEFHREQKCQQPLMPDVTQLIDEETCSDDSCGEMDPSDWTDEEKAGFLQAVSSYGKDFAMISRCVQTKSRDQCKVFFSKARKCLGLDILHSGFQNEDSPANHDTNGSGTDAEDACVVEAGSLVSTNKLSNRLEEDLPSSVMNVCDDESDPVDAINFSVDGLNKSDTEEHGEQDVGNVDSDSGTMKDSSELVLDGESNVSFGSHKQHCPPQAGNQNGKNHTNEVRNICAESVSSVVGDGAVAAISDMVEEKLVSSATDREVLKRRVSLPGNGPDGGDDNKNDVEASEVCEVKCSDRDSSAKGNGLNLGGGFPCSLLNLGPDDQQNVPLEKPEIISHSTMNSTSKDKTYSPDQLSSTLDFKGMDRERHKSVNECQQQVPRHRCAESVKLPSILQGYPLQMSVRNDVNDDASCGSSITELPLLSKSVELLSDHSKSHCRNSLDAEKICKTGNVKLFGKILTNHSVQKSYVVKNRESEKASRNEKINSKSSGIKLSGHHNADGSSGVLKFDRSGCLGLENIPVRSHGFWDGNRIQTGMSPIPDSAVLLAKYPAAFGNYTTSTPRLEPHSFQTVAKVAERTLSGVSAFGQREISCNTGVVDYAMYRSRDGPKVQQPFTVDVKHRQDLYGEVQRRNGFDALGSLHQQQGRNSIVGMNGVGRQGILVGGSCAGVSDPVAAIRMHYANIVDQYGGQNGSIVRENESWGGKTDIGR